MPCSSGSPGFVGRHPFTVSQVSFTLRPCSGLAKQLFDGSWFGRDRGRACLPIGSPSTRRTHLKLAPTWRRDWASVSWLAWPRKQTELGLRNPSECSLRLWGPHCVMAPLTGSPTSAWRPKRSVRRTTGANLSISSSMNSMGFNTACLTRNGCKRRRAYR